MKLQYYEEIIKYSSIETTEIASGESSSEEVEDNEIQSANASGNSSGISVCHRPPPTCSPHEWKLLQIIIIWVTILSTTSLLPITKDEMKFTIGVAVNINLIFFYAAPLSTIMTVIRTKSSESIHLGTMVMNTFNAFFWCVYSLAIQDDFILIPNGLGFFFGLVQVTLFLCYPSNDNNNITVVGSDESIEDENEII